MTFNQFKQLVRGGETATVDFKIACNAFNRQTGDHEKAKAELVKDICAMANNGPQASYLLIGVSDNGRQFQAVTNANLTSANIQTLVRDAIHPRPRVRVYDKCWPGAPIPFRDKRFVIIQVGPNPKAAYRLARDYVEDGSRYCFRKHQVWVRNEDTSDIAAPEQILQLLTKRKKADPPATFDGVDYQRLPQSDQLLAASRDLKELLKELGFRIYRTPRHSVEHPLNTIRYQNDFRVHMKIGKTSLILRCGVRRELEGTAMQDVELCRAWSLEHGILVLVLGNFNKAARSPNAQVQFSTEWGWFSLFKTNEIGARYFIFSVPIPHKWGHAHISFFTLPRITNTKRLRDAFTAMLASVDTDATIKNHLIRGQRELSSLVRRWKKLPSKKLKSEWVPPNFETFVTFRENLKSIK